MSQYARDEFTKAGFQVQEFSGLHWRVRSGEIAIDYWPTKGTYRQIGASQPIQGAGLPNLLAAFKEAQVQPIVIPLQVVERSDKGTVMEVCDLAVAEIVDTVTPKGSTTRKVEPVDVDSQCVRDALKLMGQSPYNLTGPEVMTLMTAVNYMANKLGVKS